MVVAPHAGARIETPPADNARQRSASLPMRERELKRPRNADDEPTGASLPMRERELKHLCGNRPSNGYPVAPHAGARIETPRHWVTKKC